MANPSLGLKPLPAYSRPKMAPRPNRGNALAVFQAIEANGDSDGVVDYIKLYNRSELAHNGLRHKCFEKTLTYLVDEGYILELIGVSGPRRFRIAPRSYYDNAQLDQTPGLVKPQPVPPSPPRDNPSFLKSFAPLFFILAFALLATALLN